MYVCPTEFNFKDIGQIGSGDNSVSSINTRFGKHFYTYIHTYSIIEFRNLFILY